MTDNVNHPPHYNAGKIEVIEFIEDQKLDYPCGNAVKYICRAGKKNPDKEVEDLEKAVWYLSRKIEVLKAAKEGRDPKRPNAMNIRVKPIDILWIRNTYLDDLTSQMREEEPEGLLRATFKTPLLDLPEWTAFLPIHKGDNV